MSKEEIKAAIAELEEEGYHLGCPWKDIEREKIEAIKQMPPSAFRMVLMTYNACSQVGKTVGMLFATGLILFVLGLVALGALAVYKLIVFFK